MKQPVIRIRDVGKQYLLGGRQKTGRTFREMLSDAFKAPVTRLRRLGGEICAAQSFWALQGINLDIDQGDIVGIIGRNGAGKSTLLKILSRITEPTTGRIEIRGRLASLLEVGTGFHSELTGRENIFLNGAILGMSRKEIARKFDEIVAFAEIEQFIDTPVKHYSSGMYVRLAFAVAAHLESEILIVDEVLAVGDAAFQQKCLQTIRDAAQVGRTVVFVSHNMNAVERLCTRALWLEGGKVAGTFADVRQGIMAYFSCVTTAANINIWRTSGGEFDNDYFRPDLFSIESSSPSARSGEPFSNQYSFVIRIAGLVRRVEPAFNVGIAMYSEDGSLLLWSFIRDGAAAACPHLRPGLIEWRVRIPARWLNEGSYRVELVSGLHNRSWILNPGGGAPTIGFVIQGGLSDSPYWDRRRSGLLAPVLQWEAQAVVPAVV